MEHQVCFYLDIDAYSLASSPAAPGFASGFASTGVAASVVADASTSAASEDEDGLTPEGNSIYSYY
jgi:hypothetical protein